MGETAGPCPSLLDGGPRFWLRSASARANDLRANMSNDSL